MYILDLLMFAMAIRGQMLLCRVLNKSLYQYIYMYIHALSKEIVDSCYLFKGLFSFAMQVCITIVRNAGTSMWTSQDIT